MIRYIDGNLLDDSHEFDVIGHGCNNFCTMGSGIAPQIKAKFPEAYEVDCATIKGDRNKLGTITHTVNTTPIVVNIYSQHGYNGRAHGEIDLDYNALRLGLRAMKKKFSGKTFGLNRLGSGLAGGDWTIIEKIIEEEMMGEMVTIVNYVP
jgi:O-acetyl-ADP-ribose deacetylase (regulator of RNase III)